MEINSIGRHLLSIGSFSSSPVGATFPVFSLVCGVAASFIVVIALILCVCGEKPKNTTENKTESTVEIRDKKERKSDRKSLKSQTSVKNGVAVEAKDVTIDMEQLNRHSNGSVSNGHANGRPLSHDQRALPEIPNNPVGAAVSDLQTDEDEEDVECEGHYDIIHGPKKGTNGQQQKPSAVRAKVGNQYEDVDLENNPTYDGIRDDVTSDPGYAGIPANNPYATVTGIGSAVYARIDEKSKTSNPVQRRNSRETINSSVSVPPPPVPDKNFETQEEIQVGGASALIAAHAQVPGPGGSSPNLPPRNGAASGDSPEIIGDATLAMPAPVAMVAVSSSQNGASISVASGSGAAGGDGSGAAKAEPPYSKVTARESLQNMRDRGVDLDNLHSFKDPLEEVTYETVNYEQIKSTGGMAGVGTPRRAGDRTSLTSDLYAEIEGGETSTRSSMYATVGEGKSAQDSHAPTPPPVDMLRNFSNASDDETPDPGYSKIKRPRPKTVGAAADIGASEGTGLPIYAKVDKNRKKRNTTHLGEEKVEDVDMAKMYAKVNKPKNQNRNGYEDIDLISSPHNGARPKVRDNSFNGNSSNGSARPSNHNRKKDHNANARGGGDPGYSTIDLENNYDCIDGKSAESDIDPNYDRIQFGATAESGGLTLDSSSRTRTIPGVATEITEDANANPQLSSSGINQTRPKREHIYQEISEAQKDKEKIVFATSL